MRLFAQIVGNIEPPKTKHYKGLPPKVTEGADSRVSMNAPIVLVIEEREDGVFLYHFDAKADCVGDTWHHDIDEAKEQARSEFQNHLTHWTEVPTEDQDIQKFVRGLFPGDSKQNSI